jgi:hypothetical protein
VDRGTVERAKQIVLGYRQLSARDAVPLSVTEQNATHQILSFDSDLTRSLVLPVSHKGLMEATPNWM